MQRAALFVVPDNAVVRLHRRSVDGLREIVALEHQRIVAGSRDFPLDVERRRHAFCSRIASAVRSRPSHLIAFEFSKDGGIEGWRIATVRVGVVLLQADKSCCAKMRRRLGPGHDAITNDLVVEANAALGGIVASEVFVDEERDGLSEQPRGLSLRHQKHVTVESGTMRGYPVAEQVFRGDQSVGLQVAFERGEIDDFEYAIGLRGVDQKCMTLLARPARQIPSAKVSREGFLASDLCQGIGTVTESAIRIKRTRQAIGGWIELERRSIRSNDIETKGNSGSNSALQQFSARDRGWHAALLSNPVYQQV